MNTHACCIPGCISNLPGRIKIPKAEFKRDLWFKSITTSLAHLDYVNWRTWKLPTSSNSRLCVYHFHRSEILKSKKTDQREIQLKYDAIPHIFHFINDAQDDQHEVVESVSMEAMERAVSLLAKDVKWSSLLPSDHLRRCNPQFAAYQRSEGVMDALPQHTPKAILEHMRSALLRHRWNDVAKLLPYCFHLPNFKSMIWKTALQVVCHHPDSSEMEMMNLIRTCLQMSDVPVEYLRKIFCVQQIEDSDLLTSLKRKSAAMHNENVKKKKLPKK